MVIKYLKFMGSKSCLSNRTPLNKPLWIFIYIIWLLFQQLQQIEKRLKRRRIFHSLFLSGLFVCSRPNFKYFRNMGVDLIAQSAVLLRNQNYIARIVCDWEML